MNILTEKFKEVSLSITPIFLSVLLMHAFLIDLSMTQLVLFVFSTILLLLGLTMFLIGVDLAIIPLGRIIGPLLAKGNRLSYLIIFGFIIGFSISFAEPSLLITAGQVANLSQQALSASYLITVVSIGIGAMVVVGLIRLMFQWQLKYILLVGYGVIMILSVLSSSEMLAIAFDASAVTTGILAVPFLLSVSLGITARQKDAKASNQQSFGLIAIASIGAIITVLLISVVSDPQLVPGPFEPIESGAGIIDILKSVLGMAWVDTFVSMVPLVMIFLIVVKLFHKISNKALYDMIFGFGYAFVGLFLFLLSINASYLYVGNFLGYSLMSDHSSFLIVVLGFVFGVVTILAEPAVYVLTHQIEEVTAGSVKRSLILITLALGVGLAVSLSVMRILIPSIQLWHYLLPGYVISILLSFIVPSTFVGIAFDAGGVATGPMTATFILAFIHGIAQANPNANILVDGFGMVAMVALMPILTLQLLGLSYKVVSKRR